MEKTQGKFCKKDLLMRYDNVTMKVFESWIADIMDEIGWIKGKQQVLSPSQVRRILEHLGDPIPLTHLNS